MTEENQACRDPFYDQIPKHMWVSITNIGVKAEGMVRVILRINETEKELYHGYVTDGIVSHSHNLTGWLHKR